MRGRGKREERAMVMQPTRCLVDVAEGALEGGTGRYEKRLSDLAGVYGDEAAFAALVAKSGNPVVYAVEDLKPSTAAGDMIFGITRMAPGKVGEEYFVTRGHIHAVANRPEIYYGESGTGLMLLESPEGEIRILEIGAKAVCYVPPYWIHRSVNVGRDDLVMTFAYPADSGQDYDIIARSGGMRQRIVDDGAGGWKAAPNPGYRARDAGEVARVFATAA
jgi:glucose-6-phosphate isomerase